MNFLSLIGGIFEPLAKLVDNLHTSEEEKGKLRMGFVAAQVQFGQAMLDYEKDRLATQAKIIEAETKAESWVTRSWRPITMLVFLGLLCSYWFGYAPEGITQETLNKLFTLLQIGIGGYITSRGVEKVAPAIADAFKNAGK